MILTFLLLPTAFSINFASKIASGVEVKSTLKYPFLVDIEKEFMFDDNSTILDLHCGGVFLPPNSILTAAHCSFSKIEGREQDIITGSELDTLVVYGNRLNRSDFEDPNAVKFKVEKIIVHPKFNATAISFDAAIWKVSLVSGDLTTFTTQINLDTDISSKSWFGTNATIAGFGALYGDPLLQTRMLLDAQVPIITPSQCKQFYKVDKIDDSWICAGNPNPHKDVEAGTCFGDSGGPMFVSNLKNSITLIGIISNGANVKCGHQPDAFTKIAVIRSWIIQNTVPIAASKLEVQAKTSASELVSINISVIAAMMVSIIYLGTL